MPIIVKPPDDFEIPDEGSHEAEIMEVKDQGIVDTKYGKKPKVLFSLNTNQLDKDGKPRKLFHRLNKNLHAKSELRQFIKSVTGEDPSHEIDLETLAGRKVIVHVEHNVRDGKRYANIKAVIRLKPNGKAQAD
jgi:hypothetical protein